MTNTTTEGEILKQDKLGRVITAVDRRQALVEKFESSGMSGAQFAAFYGIKYTTFSTWRAKWRQQGEQARTKAAPMRLLEVSVEEEGKNHSALVVHLGCGGSLELSGANQVELAAELLWALELRKAKC